MEMYKYTYTTNCIGDNINLVVKGTIPTWIYEYLPLPKKIGIYNIVSINVIPFPGLSIDNTDEKNQCSMDLSSMSLNELN